MAKKVGYKGAVLEAILASVTILWLGAPGAMAQSANLLDRLNGNYAFRMTPAKSFSASAPGDPGGVAAAPRQDILRVGVFAADGNGNLKGHSIATTDTDNGQTWIVMFDWTGKYTVNSDGTGYFSVDGISNMVCTNTTVSHTGPTPHPAAPGGSPSAGNVACPANPSVEGHEDYAFVFSTPGGKDLEFIETDNEGGGAKIFLTGTATHQQSLGSATENNEDQDDQNGNRNGNGRGNG